MNVSGFANFSGSINLNATYAIEPIRIASIKTTSRVLEEGKRDIINELINIPITALMKKNGTARTTNPKRNHILADLTFAKATRKGINVTSIIQLD